MSFSPKSPGCLHVWKLSLPLWVYNSSCLFCCSLSLSPPSHSLYLSHNSLSLSLCSLTSLSQSHSWLYLCNTPLSLFLFYPSPLLFHLLSLCLSLNNFRFHFWRSINALSHSSPPFLLCISSKSHHSSISLWWEVVWLPAWLTAGRVMDTGWDPVHYTPLQHSTTETRHYCITLHWIQNDAQRRMINKIELKWRRNDKQRITLGEHLQTLSSLRSWAKINTATYQPEWKL